ncbi:MAG TPA: integrase core domain-containing protein, partial [Myxococcota bacterium]|nr:integrase core domain-containing protein [Myxococcota bacterium]
RFWPGWRHALVLVRPETVIRWHRRGFRLYWRWKRRSRRPGRPTIEAELRDLTLEMHRANPTWGAPRIHGELLKLGFTLAQSTVSKYLPRHRKPPSQSWRSFLQNHLPEALAIDFAVVPTATFRLLYMFVVLSLERRRLLHVHVTAHPTAAWTAQQMVEALPEETRFRYLIRDRDGIYGAEFRRRVAGLGLREVPIAPHSPWQNPYAERFIGSLRRECLDHMIVLNERQASRILSAYACYYNRARTHLALDKDAPESRRVQGRDSGRVIALQEVRGLHHRYERVAA